MRLLIEIFDKTNSTQNDLFKGLTV